MRVLKDPLTGEMTLEGGALVLADQVLFFLRILDKYSFHSCIQNFAMVTIEAWVALCKG